MYAPVETLEMLLEQSNLNVELSSIKFLGEVRVRPESANHRLRDHEHHLAAESSHSELTPLS